MTLARHEVVVALDVAVGVASPILLLEVLLVAPLVGATLRASISFCARLLQLLTSSSTVPKRTAALYTFSVTSSILELSALLSSLTSSGLATVFIILLIMASREPMVRGSSGISGGDGSEDEARWDGHSPGPKPRRSTSGWICWSSPRWPVAHRRGSELNSWREGGVLAEYFRYEVWQEDGVADPEEVVGVACEVARALKRNLGGAVYRARARLPPRDTGAGWAAGRTSRGGDKL